MKNLFPIISLFGIFLNSCWDPNQERAEAYHEKLKENREKFETIIYCFTKDQFLERVVTQNQGNVEVNCNDCRFNNRKPSVRWHALDGKKVIIDDELSEKYFDEFPQHREMIEALLELEINDVYKSWGFLFFEIGLGQQHTFGLIYDYGSKVEIRSKLRDGEFLSYGTIPLEIKWYYAIKP